MRKFPFNFCSMGPLGMGVAGSFWLVILLLAPLPAGASSKRLKTHRAHTNMQAHPQIRHAHRTAQLHRSPLHPHHRVKTSANRRIARRHSRAHESSPYIHRAAQYRRRGSRASVQRYQLRAALDDISSHTTPVETAGSAKETTPISDTPEVPSQASLVDSGHPSTAQAQTDTVTPATEAGVRAIPAFNIPVPRYMPVALRGSHEVLVHQNIVADVEGLSRIQNDEQLSSMIHSGDLVALPASVGLVIDSRLPLNRRYCRPWTARFLSDLSRAHEKAFGRPLQLTSAVRTVEFQRHLAHYNGNAAPAYGDTASPHLTGEAIDLGKKGMSRHEIAWMRTVLGKLQDKGKLDVEEEFEQACFHISVYKTYGPQRSLPPSLVAGNEAEPADVTPAPDAAADGPIGGLARPASEPVARSTWTRHRRSYAAHTARHAVVHRRRHHRHAMSLLAVRMR